MLVPNLEILSERRLHTPGERSLGAAIEVYLALENGELGADRQDRVVIECQERLLQFHHSRISIALKKDIITGQDMPGDALSEKTLAKRYRGRPNSGAGGGGFVYSRNK